MSSVLPVRTDSVERSELAEREVIHKEREERGWKTPGEHCGEIVTVDLDASVTVIRGHDPVLSEDKVQSPAGLPPPQINLDRGVRLRVPLVYLVKPVENVAVHVARDVLGELELLLLVKESKV